MNKDSYAQNIELCKNCRPNEQGHGPELLCELCMHNHLAVKHWRDRAEAGQKMLLHLAYGVALSDHVGDVWGELEGLFKLAGLDPLVFDENSGEVDFDALKARGARGIYELLAERKVNDGN